MLEKIDSEYIDISIFEHSMSIDGKTKETLVEFTIWDDGEIFFDVLEDFQNEIKLTLDELTEIVRIAKMYRDRRTFYLAHNKND